MLLPFTLKALALCGLLSGGLQVTEGQTLAEKDWDSYLIKARNVVWSGLELSKSVHPDYDQFLPDDPRQQALKKGRSLSKNLSKKFIMETKPLVQKELAGYTLAKSTELACKYLLHETSTLYAWLANALEGKDSFRSNWFVTKEKVPIIRTGGEWTAENLLLMEIKVPRRLTLLFTLYRFTGFFADYEQRHFRRAIALALSAYYLRIRIAQDPAIDHITIPLPGLGNGAKESFALSSIPTALKTHLGSLIYTVKYPNKVVSAYFPCKFLEPLIVRAIVADDDDEYQDHLEALIIEWSHMRTFFQGSTIVPGWYKDSIKRMQLIIKKLSPTEADGRAFKAFSKEVELASKSQPSNGSYRD